MKSKHIALIGMALLITLTTSLSSRAATLDSTTALSTAQCRVIVATALDKLQNLCNQVGRNNACYGNDQISVEYNADTAPRFEQVGDRVPLKVLRTLKTSAMNVEQGTWGLSLLKLQANLPDTMPGQNVTFLVYGDTTIQNASSDMQVFYFSSGLGTPTCTEMPADGIVIQSPNHMKVTFTANGVKFDIASTVYLSAVPNKSMTVALFDGHAKLTTAAGVQTLEPGQMSSIALGGPSGLEASGKPSKPAAIGNASRQAFDKIIGAARANENNDKLKGSSNGSANSGSGSGNSSNGRGSNGNGSGNSGSGSSNSGSGSSNSGNGSSNSGNGSGNGGNGGNGGNSGNGK